MSMKKSLGLLFLFVTNFSNAQFIEHEDRDKSYPIPSSFVWGTTHQVGLFTHMRDVKPTCLISRSSKPKSLPLALRDLSGVKYEAIFDYTVKEHIQKNSVMGLTFVRDGKIIYENFNFERRADDLFTSFSAGKSIISILIGIALDEGLIKSLDDPVEKYTNRINDSSYSKIKISSLLRMSSGIPYTEPDTAKGDATDFEQSLENNSTSDITESLKKWQRKSAGEGKKFNYASIETAVLAEMLRGATGKSICQYTQEKLWEPLGAEFDAHWETDSKGNELGYVGFNATQTDYAKIGVMLANMGEMHGIRVLSSEYIDQATNVERQPEGFKFNQPEFQSAYGYQFWLRQQPGRYFMNGSYGQYVGVDRNSKSVLVIHTADVARVNKVRSLRTLRLFQSLIKVTNP
jgi:CubicO group peptidase (beta-lactamase class C family)